MVTKTGILETFLKDKGFGFVKMDEDIDDVFVHVRDNPNLSIDIVGQHCTIELMVTKDGKHGRKQKGRNLTVFEPEAPVFEPVTCFRTEAPVFEPVTVPWIDPRRNQEESPVFEPVNIDTRPEEPRRIFSRDKHFVFEATDAQIDRLRSIDKD